MYSADEVEAVIKDARAKRAEKVMRIARKKLQGYGSDIEDIESILFCPNGDAALDVYWSRDTIVRDNLFGFAIEALLDEKKTDRSEKPNLPTKAEKPEGFFIERGGKKLELTMKEAERISEAYQRRRFVDDFAIELAESDVAAFRRARALIEAGVIEPSDAIAAGLSNRSFPTRGLEDAMEQAMHELLSAI